jgi:hypothetical protein
MPEDYLRVSLPGSVADVLIEDGLAVTPYRTRGPSTTQALEFVVNGINTGASVVTLVITANALKKLAARLWALARRADRPLCTISITTSDGTRQIDIAKGDTSAEDKILDFVIAALPSDVPKQ